jgi:hypothetical protein
MKIIYRFSDKGNEKNKPEYVTKRKCLLHMLHIFKDYDIYIFADNISDESYEFISNNIPNKNNIYRTELSNCGSFIYCVLFAINNFNDEENIYFAEDDYIYTLNSPKILEEGLEISDYVSGYDHPDKYINSKDGGPNPYISEGGELTRVLLTSNHHWKLTNSCCMTFACKVKTLKEDIDLYIKYCSNIYPHDFELFTELTQDRKRRLISAIPAVSTHGETEWLSPLIDWKENIENIFKKKM